MRKILVYFLSEYKEEPKKTLVGAYRAEPTSQNTAGSGITTTNPPLFDGSTYEELTEDWLDLTVLEETQNEDQH